MFNRGLIMAKKDLVEYYLQIQDQYFTMLSDFKELNEDVRNGLVEQSIVDNLKNDLELVRMNYERLSYELFLLNQPQKKDKKEGDYKRNKQWYDYLKGSSKEAILNENADALADFKKYVKEIRDGVEQPIK